MQTWPDDDARTLLKEAAALKRAKRYDEAVALLRRAYDAPARYPMTIEEILLLPMYLQLGGHIVDGWSELVRLNVTYMDVWSQLRIAEQTTEFLRTEGEGRYAAQFAVWTLCKQKEVDADVCKSIECGADHKMAADAERQALPLPPSPQTTRAIGTTPSGNPIYDIGYPAVRRRLTRDCAPAIGAALKRDLTKVVAKETIAALTAELASYLATEPPYDLAAVNRIFRRHLA